MSVIKTKKIICDFCHKEIKPYLWWYSFRYITSEKKTKMHLCHDCFNELRRTVREKQEKEKTH